MLLQIKFLIVTAAGTIFCTIFFSIFTLSCVSHLKTQPGVPDISPAEYQSLLEQKTRKVEVYNGLHNILTVQATWLDSQLSEALLSQSARNAQWNELLYKEERSKKINKNAESTELFVSLFTPERKHADLSKAKSIWKIFLEVNGQRYEGKALKIKLLLSEIQALYPYHNRWSTPYIVSFPVATSLVENKPAILTLTSAVGSAQLTY